MSVMIVKGKVVGSEKDIRRTTDLLLKTKDADYGKDWKKAPAKIL